MTPAFASGSNRRRWARGHERSFLSNRAVTIDTINLDRRARLAVDFSVAVIVLLEMAIVALHPFFEMNVGEMHRFTEAVRIVERDLLAVPVEPVSSAVVVEHGPEDPAMSVKIRELRGLQLLVEFRAARLLQELFAAPKSARRCCFRVAEIGLISLFF